MNRLNDEGHFIAFNTMMRDLFSYFGSVYKTDRVAAIYQDVSEIAIPPDAFPEIGKQLRRELDSTSGNLGRRVIEAWGGAKKQFTGAMGKQPCQLCNSAGIFSAGKDSAQGYVAWHTYRCAGCTNWHGIYGSIIPAAYPLEKKREGYLIKTFLPAGWNPE
jgi:hypothetical protein